MPQLKQYKAVRMNVKNVSDPLFVVGITILYSSYTPIRFSLKMSCIYLILIFKDDAMGR